MSIVSVCVYGLLYAVPKVDVVNTHQQTIYAVYDLSIKIYNDMHFTNNCKHVQCCSRDAIVISTNPSNQPKFFVVNKFYHFLGKLVRVSQ